MKKIKFRGTTFDGQTFYGDFVRSVPVSNLPGILDEDGFIHEVDPDSIAQFAGLDAAGREVYEGDTIFITGQTHHVMLHSFPSTIWGYLLLDSENDDDHETLERAAMIGYKGFDRNLCCLDFQYEVGKTYHYDDDIEIGESGFHFCDTPLAVFKYYRPSESRFALVEASGKIDSDNEHLFCTDEITIVKELSLDEIIAVAVTN